LDNPLKRCTRCGDEYPATPEYFDRHNQLSSGLHPWCKPCRKANAAERWLKAHPVPQRGTEGRAARLERRRAYAREWRLKNRDKTRQYGRERVKKYPEKFKAKKRSYAARNRDYFRAKSSARRARMRLTEKPHTAQDISAQLIRQNRLCYWCSQPVPPNYHVDHVIPVARGGSNAADNIVITCPHCNQTKNDRLPFVEWTPPNPLQFN